MVVNGILGVSISKGSLYSVNCDHVSAEKGLKNYYTFVKRHDNVTGSTYTMTWAFSNA